MIPRPTHRVLPLCFICFVALLFGQPPKSPTKTVPPAKPRKVFAKVNDARLLVAELEARLRQMPKSKVETTIRRRRELMVETLIRQQLVLEYLRSRSLGANSSEVEKAYRNWESELAAKKLDANEYFRRTGMDEDAVRRRFEWLIGWPRFVERKLTRKTLEKYFADHQSEFDGTRMRVAHVLFKPGKGETSDQIQASEVREKIVSGKMTFEEAAKAYSQAPTAEEGGVVGWIEWHQPMHPAFSQAAFELQPSEISKPVETPFGLHLIRCLEVQPGDRTLDDVMPAVKQAAINDMFRALASRARRSARIKVRKAIPAASQD